MSTLIFSFHWVCPKAHRWGDGLRYTERRKDPKQEALEHYENIHRLVQHTPVVEFLWNYVLKIESGIGKNLLVLSDDSFQYCANLCCKLLLGLDSVPDFHLAGKSNAHILKSLRILNHIFGEESWCTSVLDKKSDDHKNKTRHNGVWQKILP